MCVCVCVVGPGRAFQTLSEVDQEPRTQSTLTALSPVLSYQSNSSPPGAAVRRARAHTQTHTHCVQYTNLKSPTPLHLCFRRWCE